MWIVRCHASSSGGLICCPFLFWRCSLNAAKRDIICITANRRNTQSQLAIAASAASAASTASTVVFAAATQPVATATTKAAASSTITTTTITVTATSASQSTLAAAATDQVDVSAAHKLLVGWSWRPRGRLASRECSPRREDARSMQSSVRGYACFWL